MGSAADRGVIGWLPWGGEAFRRARDERRPILLSIVAAWAPGCAEMDRCSYADARIVEAVNATVVPVRVDADQRPDIADRYDLGGLPTTVFLDADGRLLGGGTFVSAERLRDALATLAARGERGISQAPASTAAPGAERDVSDAEIEDIVLSSYDTVFGGFGGAPKFPIAAPIQLAVDLYLERQSPRLLECATRTLDAIGWGPLYDEDAGGFFRCASGDDWGGPHRQRLLSTNAALLEIFVHAGSALEQDRWLRRASDLVDYLKRILTPDGWPVADRLGGPCFCDGNAQAVSAMLHAAAVTQDDETGRRVLAVLERVLLSAYKPGHGVAHGAGGVRGLLTDQVAMAGANLDAWDATGNIVYRMMAEELMHYALRTMWDDERGGLFDRDESAEPGEVPAQRMKPFVLNCEAALVLQRLAQAVNEPQFARRAALTLDAMRPMAAAHGPIAAHYLLARRAVLR
jgi:hypothetical protein